MCFSVEAKPTTLESLQPHAQSDCPDFEVKAMQCGYLDEMKWYSWQIMHLHLNMRLWFLNSSFKLSILNHLLAFSVDWPFWVKAYSELLDTLLDHILKQTNFSWVVSEYSSCGRKNVKIEIWVQILELHLKDKIWKVLIWSVVILSFRHTCTHVHTKLGR